MLGLGESELSVLGDVVQSVVTPLKDKIEELTAKITELERVIEQQGYDRLAESIAASPVPLLLAVPEKEYSGRRGSSDTGAGVSDAESGSEQRRPRKKLPVPGKKRGSGSLSLEEGEIQLISSSTTSSISFSPEPKGGESQLVAKDSIDEISETKSCFSEFDRASTMSKSYESLVDSRYASAEDTRLSPDKIKPPGLKLPHKKTPSTSSSPVKEPNLDPLQENVVLHLKPPPLTRGISVEDELDKTPEPNLNLSVPTPVATPIPLIPTPIPCLEMSEYQSLYEQKPAGDSVEKVETLPAEEIETLEPIQTVSSANDKAEQPLKSIEAEKCKVPPPLVRTASVEELVSKFEHIDHNTLSNETASTKRSIFQQRRKTKSPEKSRDTGFVLVESMNDSVTDSSLEKVTQVDPEALTPYTLSPWNSLYLSEDPRDLKKSVDHSSDDLRDLKKSTDLSSDSATDFHEPVMVVDLSLDKLEEDTEPETLNMDELETIDQLSVPEKSSTNSPPTVKTPEVVPSPVSPTPSHPSFAPSPEPSQRSRYMDQYASSDNEEALNPAPIRTSSTSLNESTSTTKKSRRFSVQNIIKKFDSSSDTERPRREKSSPSPINLLIKKIVSSKKAAKKLKQRPESCPPMPRSPSNDSVGSSYREVSLPSPTSVTKSNSKFDLPSHKPPAGLVKRMKRRLSRSQSFDRSEQPLSESETDVPYVKPARPKRFSVAGFISRMASPKKRDYTTLLHNPDQEADTPLYTPVEIKPVINLPSKSPEVDKVDYSYEDYEIIDSDPENVDTLDQVSSDNWANFDSAFSNQSISLERLPPVKERSPSVTSVASSSRPPPSPASSTRRRSLTKSHETRVPRYAPCVMPPSPTNSSTPEQAPLTSSSKLKRMHRFDYEHTDVRSSREKLKQSPSVEKIISKFESQNLEELTPHLAVEMSNNHAFQKAIFDIIEEEGYALINHRQKARNESTSLFTRGDSLEDLVDKAKSSTNLDLEYLRDVARIQRSENISNSDMIDGLKALIDDNRYQGPRRLFLCSFMCNIVNSINHMATIEPIIIKRAYQSTIKDFKSTSDAIEAIQEPQNLAIITNRQNNIVMSLLESLISISFQSIFERGKVERYTRDVVHGLLRKDFYDKIQHHRKEKFLASVQIRNLLTRYFKNFLARPPPRKTKIKASNPPLKVAQRSISFSATVEEDAPSTTTTSAITASRAQTPPKPTKSFKRTRTKVYRDKAKKMVEFKTQYIVKLCISNMFESMSHQYRQRQINRRFHFTDLCKTVISNIVTEEQFYELVSCVIQELISKYLYSRIAIIRNYSDDLTDVTNQMDRPSKLQTFYREKSGRGTEVVERWCYSPLPIPEEPTVLEEPHPHVLVSQATLCAPEISTCTDFSCQVTLTNQPTSGDDSRITSPFSDHYKEYTTSTTQIIPGDFDPSPPVSLTSLLTQTDIASTQTDLPPTPTSVEERRSSRVGAQEEVRWGKRKRPVMRALMGKSRSLDSALGDDSIVSDTNSVVSKGKS